MHLKSWKHQFANAHSEQAFSELLISVFIGEAEVQVRITDKNDNAPFFRHKQYNATVPENTDVGAVIMTVTSEDEDDGT